MTEAGARGAGDGPLAVVCSKALSSWVSCRSITAHLAQAYRLRFGPRAEFFDYSAAMDSWQTLKLARRLRARGAAKLVFLDHAPHPHALLAALRLAYGTRPLPALYFHVYGDFTFYARSWYEAAPLLERARATFICASDRQRDLVGRFLAAPSARPELCPFPVEASRFRFDPLLRREARAAYGIGPDEAVFLYAGRISLQKNVIPLMRIYARAAARLRRPSRLLLAGGFDDLGAPFFGIHPRDGDYFRHWNRQRAALPASARDRIVYVGNVSAAELPRLYHAADLYASLSLHHDEDFGMAPAEALCSGTPAALTDWGGYASFPSPGRADDARLIPLTLTRRGLALSADAAEETFVQRAGRRESDARRDARSRRSLARFSIEAAAARIGRIHRKSAPAFSGFSSILKWYSEIPRREALFPGGPSRTPRYTAVYSAYLKKGA